MFDKFIGNVARGVFKVGLQADKHSPELLLVAGLLAGAAAIYTTITATLEVNTVLDSVNENKKLIETAKEEHSDVYTEENYKHDVAVLRKDAAVGMVKLYYRPALFFILSTTCYFAAHKILKDRNVAIAAALKLTQEAFDKYRENVRLDQGEEVDRRYRYGLVAPAGEKDYEVRDGDIEDKEERKGLPIIANGNDYSQYAVCFDEGNPNWSNTPEYNLMFLKSQQNYFNDKLRARGHVFLNEVYRALGFRETSAGAIVGWVIGKGNDNFIDFGIYNIKSEAARDFVNGYEPSVWLDFNVDGVIYDLI